MAKISITELTQALPITQNTWTRCDIQITSFGRFFCLISILIVIWCLAKDNTPCRADSNTQVVLVTNNVEHSNGLHNIWT